MSMAQDPSQYHYSGDSGARFHARQGSASSVLAATTFGVPYNPLATPSNVSAYGSVSWPSSLNVSPSIWSQNHQGNASWSVMGHERQGSYGFYNPTGSYAYAPPRMYGSVGFGQPAPPHHNMVPATLRQNMQQQQQPILVVPQMQPVAQLQPQMHAPLVGPYMAPPMAHAHPAFPVRAPLQPYQTISPPDATTSNTEYDVPSFSKFFVSIVMGIIMGNSDSEDSNQLEQYMATLLCATRLQKSTVLMSFVLLNRWDKVSSAKGKNSMNFGPAANRSVSTLKCQIVCSLVLANKMNDDNTFTNASWSLISGIPASQITQFELAWLDALQWRLSLDENGTSEWHYWQKCWDQYDQNLQGARSPVSPVGGWTSGGFVFEPFSVAAC